MKVGEAVASQNGSCVINTNLFNIITANTLRERQYRDVPAACAQQSDPGHLAMRTLHKQHFWRFAGALSRRRRR
eukprot:2844056-Prymnesium_polylepis.1